MKAVLAGIAVGRDRLGDDRAQAGPLPVLAGQHVVGAGEREQAGLERGLRLVQRCRVAQGLGRDGLHGGQRVLHPVVQLVDQKPLVLLRLLGLGDVARDRQELVRPSRRARGSG